MAEDSGAGRRDILKAGLGAGLAALTPWHGAAAQSPAAPREKTMVLVWSGSREGRWVDSELWNPYSIGSNHQNGPNIVYEPLAYYSAFADKTYMWLAESYNFSADFKQLTIKTRSGIKWSDGKPFSAEDVAFTLNGLRDLGPKVRFGVDVQQAVAKATATDANGATIQFTPWRAAVRRSGTSEKMRPGLETTRSAGSWRAKSASAHGCETRRSVRS